MHYGWKPSNRFSHCPISFLVDGVGKLGWLCREATKMKRFRVCGTPNSLASSIAASHGNHDPLWLFRTHRKFLPKCISKTRHVFDMI